MIDLLKSTSGISVIKKMNVVQMMSSVNAAIFK